MDIVKMDITVMYCCQCHNGHLQIRAIQEIRFALSDNVTQSGNSQSYLMCVIKRMDK